MESLSSENTVHFSLPFFTPKNSESTIPGNYLITAGLPDRLFRNWPHLFYFGIPSHSLPAIRSFGPLLLKLLKLTFGIRALFFPYRPTGQKMPFIIFSPNQILTIM